MPSTSYGGITCEKGTAMVVVQLERRSIARYNVAGTVSGRIHLPVRQVGAAGVAAQGEAV